jgi:hypothetical protein
MLARPDGNFVSRSVYRSGMKWRSGAMVPMAVTGTATLVARRPALTVGGCVVDDMPIAASGMKGVIVLLRTEPMAPTSGWVMRAITANDFSLSTRSGLENGLQKAPGSSVNTSGLFTISVSVTLVGTMRPHWESFSGAGVAGSGRFANMGSGSTRVLRSGLVRSSGTKPSAWYSPTSHHDQPMLGSWTKKVVKLPSRAS